MTWRTELRPASFRGISFHVDAATLTAGRRLARHEYPQRDIPYLEDMGRKAREYKVDALVVGADYMVQRDALLAAIESAGAGQLVHPYYGTLVVVVSGECQIAESTQHGGLARITINFIEAGQQQEPRAQVDTNAVLTAQQLQCDDSFALDFAQTFTTEGVPDFVTQDALGSLGSALAVPGMALGNLAWTRATPLSDLRALLPENMLASLATPLALARGLLAQVRNLDNPRSLLALDLGESAPSSGSASRRVLLGNRTALGSLLLQAATTRRVLDLTATTPATLEDVRTARTEIVQRTDTVLFREDTGQASADALVQLRTVAMAHFAAITPSLPRIVTSVSQVVRPALVTAHALYADDWLEQDRESELITRNRISHPGFMPAGSEFSWVSP
jgi:prophage DNA circulation protein